MQNSKSGLPKCKQQRVIQVVMKPSTNHLEKDEQWVIHYFCIIVKKICRNTGGLTLIPWQHSLISASDLV